MHYLAIQDYAPRDHECQRNSVEDLKVYSLGPHGDCEIVALCELRVAAALFADGAASRPKNTS